MTDTQLTNVQELGHFLRDYAAAENNGHAGDRINVSRAVRDPRAMLRTAATLMKTIVENVGYDYDDVIAKLIDESPTPAQQVAHSLLAATVACVVNGEHIWDPVTDQIIVTERASAETLNEVNQHIGDTIRDGYHGSDPDLWEALEMHYRRTYPDAWPPGDDHGWEYHVTTSYGITSDGRVVGPSGIVLEARDEAADESEVHILPTADADLLSRLIRYEIINPRPVPASVTERAAEVAAEVSDDKRGLRMVRDDDGGH